jgi:four helix bundle protein
VTLAACAGWQAFALGQKEFHMLRVQHLVLDIIQQLNPVLAVLARKDRDLENQLRRAATSIALNLAEGAGSFGGIKKQRYRTALASLDETRMALHVARALGYVGDIHPALSDRLAEVGRIIGALAR